MEHGEITIGEVDIFVGGNFILSVRNRSGQHLLGVRERANASPRFSSRARVSSSTP